MLHYTKSLTLGSTVEPFKRLAMKTNDLLEARMLSPSKIPHCACAKGNINPFTTKYRRVLIFTRKDSWKRRFSMRE